MGQYVSLQLKGKREYLSICEVRVYSESDIEKTECYYEADGADYRGTQTTTIDGQLCDYWDLNDETNNNFTESNYNNSNSTNSTSTDSNSTDSSNNTNLNSPSSVTNTSDYVEYVTNTEPSDTYPSVSDNGELSTDNPSAYENPRPKADSSDYILEDDVSTNGPSFSDVEQPSTINPSIEPPEYIYLGAPVYSPVYAPVYGPPPSDYYYIDEPIYFGESSNDISEQEPSLGLGDHNFCRNPDGGETAWCWYQDGASRSYCGVAGPGEACAVVTFTGELSPIGLWPLDPVCSTYRDVHLLHNIDQSRRSSKDELDVNIKNGRGPIVLPVKEDTANISGLTVALYFYPKPDSNGHIVSGYLNTIEVFSLRQPVGNKLGNSTIEVYHLSQLVTSANVIVPNTWTFLAFTYEQNRRLVKLWRNGEIASIGHLNTSIESGLEKLVIGENEEPGINAKVSYVQLYDRALSEREMKAAKINQTLLNKHTYLFHQPSSRDCSEDFSRLIVGVFGATSHIKCAQRCVSCSLCNRFVFDSTTRDCIMYVSGLANVQCGYSIHY
ncbi:uncharacterized protein [Antedon mediterranea]|uniref:uncharacterized protein n=1 Tax=Antedon mediterranea TaxID=105859 RepID=UPI003AF79063